jgi:hypothetical protein
MAKNNYQTIFAILLTAISMSGCTAELQEKSIHNNSNNVGVLLTKVDGQDSSFQQMPNPYALSVMQNVYDTYEPGVTLLPTDLYVRFLPSDSTQFRELHNLGLELFDYPLDINMNEGDVYVDSTSSQNGFHWYYTTVKPNFVFPADISHQILEQCYIPDENETITQTRSGETIDVEEEAFRNSGYEVDDSVNVSPMNASRPEGTIRVMDDYSNAYVPAKGIKVYARSFVKWAHAYTDAEGHYTINKRFIINPLYNIYFDNAKDFSIYSQFQVFSKAYYFMGVHSKHGYSLDIGTNCDAWKWASVSNAAYEYYDMCDNVGIQRPPQDLRIWVFNFTGSSSAPMLRRLNNPIGLNGDSFWLNFLANYGGYGLTVTITNQFFKSICPDITIGVQGYNYKTIYRIANHELAHASHFSKVGSPFWSKYVSYIMTYGAYGSGTGNNAQLCGIGEMWGYSMEYWQEHKKYAQATAPDSISSSWIKFRVFWDLLANNTLSEKQIYDCLNPNVEDYNTLVSTMYNNYPAKADSIELAFISNGITPTVPKPGNNFGSYDAACTDQTISTSYSLSGINVLARNVTVTNQAKLTLIGSSCVTLSSPFVINSGSQLEVRSSQ